MPTIIRDGVELYFETVGDGIPLVMLHGFMGTLEQNYHWQILLPGYQLILLDSRGHGKSGKPHDPHAYKLSERTLDVIHILDHLAIEKAHCMGYSMGGWICLGLAAAYPERFYSIIAGGIGPDALAPEPTRYWREPMIEAMKDGMEIYCQRVEVAENRTMGEDERALYISLDHKAMIAILSLEENQDIRSALAGSTTYLLMFVGELDIHHDSAKELCDALPYAQFLTIPGRNHGNAVEPQDYLVAEIKGFLEAQQP